MKIYLKYVPSITYTFSLNPHFPSALIMKLLLISSCFQRGADKSRGGVSVMYVGVEKETVVEKREWKD